MKYAIKFFIFLTLVCSKSILLAQNGCKEKFIKILFDELDKRFRIEDKIAQDSIGIYPFAAKLSIERDSSKHISVLHAFELNDSIGYLFFNDFSFLEKLDYSPLMEGKDSIKVIIPFSISVLDGENRRHEDYHVKNEPGGQMSDYIIKMFFLPFKVEEVRLMSSGDTLVRKWIASRSEMSNHIYIGPFMRFAYASKQH